MSTGTFFVLTNHTNTSRTIIIRLTMKLSHVLIYKGKKKSLKYSLNITVNFIKYIINLINIIKTEPINIS